MNTTLDVSRFRMRMERTIAFLNDRLDPIEMSRLANVFHTMKWTFPDIDLRMFVVIAGNPSRLQTCAKSGDGPVLNLVMDSSLLDSAVDGQLSFVEAFLCGRLSVTGANPMQLLKFINLLRPLLECYRQAMEASDVES